jgi:hypothetical protein
MRIRRAKIPPAASERACGSGAAAGPGTVPERVPSFPV